MIADVLKNTLPGESVSGTIVRSVPGRMILVDVKGDRHVGHEVIALKGDHILVRDDGTVRPYRGESFSELGLDTGQIVQLVRRLEALKDIVGASNSEFVIVAKKQAAESDRKAKVALTATVAVVAASAAGLLFDKSGVLLATLGSVGTAVASVFRSIF